MNIEFWVTYCPCVPFPFLLVHLCSIPLTLPHIVPSAHCSHALSTWVLPYLSSPLSYLVTFIIYSSLCFYFPSHLPTTSYISALSSLFISAFLPPYIFPCFTHQPLSQNSPLSHSHLAPSVPIIPHLPWFTHCLPFSLTYFPPWSHHGYAYIFLGESGIKCCDCNGSKGSLL